MEKLVKERTLDSSKASLNALGRHVGELLSVQLIYDCPLYYRTYDSLRTVGFKQFNKDAVQMEIASLTAIDSIKRRNGFYTQRGILYVKVGAFDQALQDFETAVRLSQATGETLYFKAWMHEQKKEYDLALELYDFMIAQSNIAVFKMAAAYAKKKKELEKERGF